MREITAKSTLRTRGAVAILAGMAYMLSGCVGDEDTTAGNPAAKIINTPAQIAQVSSSDYNNNVNGLITGQTLQRWMSDWVAERPEGVKGRLIILQTSVAVGDAPYIDTTNVAHAETYRINVGSRLTTTRSNNVVTPTGNFMADGEKMDEFLQDFNIDPRHDMIVCAGSGTGTNFTSFAMDRGRCWYTLRYWGTPAKNLAVLDGQIVNVMAGYLGDTASCDEVVDSECAPGGGKVSVRDLPEDNLSLLASMGSLAEVAEGKRDGFIWDARGMSEYDGTAVNNTRHMQGHPKGTVQLDWPQTLNPDGSYRSFAELNALFKGDPNAEFRIWDGPSDLSDLSAGEMRPLKASEQYRDGQTIYVYCETTQRAQVTGLVGAIILGKPTRYYDGAMTEWNKMTNQYSPNQPDQYGLLGSRILPADSPWRMDVPKRSNFRLNPSNDLSAVAIDDAYAANAEGAAIADRTYRLGGAAGDTGGTIDAGANPCGG